MIKKLSEQSNPLLSQPIARMIGMVAGLLLIVFISVLVFPRLLHPPLSVTDLEGLGLKERIELQQAQRMLQNEAMATLLQGASALLLLSSTGIGAYFTAQQLHINREGQITERFTRAIDQLGSGKLEVRVGGIYALARIAKDSAPDRPTIAKVLACYVRVYAPWPPAADRGRPESAQERIDANSVFEAAASEAARRPEELIGLDYLPVLEVRAADVQASLTVLGQLGEQIDLRCCDLRKSNLAWAHLEGAELRWTHLERTLLNGAHLENTNLYRAHLENAMLIGAHLDNASLYRTYLQGADLRRAHLSNTLLTDANLDGVNVDEIELDKAILKECRLRGQLPLARCDESTSLKTRLKIAIYSELQFGLLSSTC